MPFGLTSAPSPFQRELNMTLRPLLRIELVIKNKIDINEDRVLVVVAYSDDILITTKGSIKNHWNQVGKVFDLMLENNMCVEIDKCHFDQTEMVIL